MDFRQPRKVHNLPDDYGRPVHDNRGMAREKTVNHLRAWRKFRKLTQQQLADKIEPPTSKQVIAALETGQNGLSDKWLRKLAPALGTTPGFLLDHAPEDLPYDFLDIFERIPAESRDQALAVLKTFAKAG